MVRLVLCTTSFFASFTKSINTGLQDIAKLSLPTLHIGSSITTEVFNYFDLLPLAYSLSERA